jgi:hypothetical protein
VDSPAADEAPLDSAAVGELEQLLSKHDLAARQRFKTLSGPLRAAFGEEVFGNLREAMDRLDFRQAAGLLSEQLANIRG